jgi:hypothetical protein
MGATGCCSSCAPSPLRCAPPPTGVLGAIADALLFRGERRRTVPGAAVNERRLENNEGLAEYTGFALRGTGGEETRLAVARRLDMVDVEGSFVRSFAYQTGPAYGLLLDALASPARRELALEGPAFGRSRRALEGPSAGLPADTPSQVGARALRLRRQRASSGGRGARSAGVASGSRAPARRARRRPGARDSDERG